MSRHRLGTGSRNAHTFPARQALDDLFAARYRDLKRIAANLKRNDGNVTISPTALVNEAWLKMAGSPELGRLSPSHFKAIASRAMRRVLIDAARRRDAQKRAGGSDAVFITFDAALEQQVSTEKDILGLDTALRDLERLSPRQALIVEGRYFGGLTVAELAEVLELSESTVEREWRVAKAWLKLQLRGS
jgi:RNA polymerase sigma factor (TIGR02999 family)